MLRARDLLITLVLLLALWPVLILCTILVRRSSPGPILFRQLRLGQYGRTFLLLKFRSMYVNASDFRNVDGSAYSGDHDPRVTNIGRLLRRTSLDELPQLWNVLRGEMSLVGPRPDQANQLCYYTDKEKHKLTVKPGITGLAQISGRNNISWRERKALDVEYASRRSAWGDLIILIRTVPYVLLRKDISTSAPDSNSNTSASN
jgi:lipopolysaccharide/colanic/teichoic acid biosynthesis glycosyltransferase